MSWCHLVVFTEHKWVTQIVVCDYLLSYFFPGISGWSHWPMGHQGGACGDKGCEVASAAAESNGSRGRSQQGGQSQGEARHWLIFNHFLTHFNYDKRIKAAVGKHAGIMNVYLRFRSFLQRERWRPRGLWKKPLWLSLSRPPLCSWDTCRLSTPSQPRRTPPSSFPCLSTWYRTSCTQSDARGTKGSNLSYITVFITSISFCVLCWPALCSSLSSS